MIERPVNIMAFLRAMVVEDFSSEVFEGIWNMCAKKAVAALWTYPDGISARPVDSRNVFRLICDGKVSII